ncbi:MAG: chloride channel protein [Deltaproteobacteria bacterium]|nr:chloride channel protein [Deltaproteobacteria bacterium]
MVLAARDSGHRRLDRRAADLLLRPGGSRPRGPRGHEGGRPARWRDPRPHRRRQGPGVCGLDRDRRLGGPRGPDRSDRLGLRFDPGAVDAAPHSADPHPRRLRRSGGHLRHIQCTHRRRALRGGGDRGRLRRHPAFEVPVYDLVSPLELLPYMVTGVVAGLVAVAFIRSLNATEVFFERLSFPPYLQAMLGGLLVGVIAIELPQVFGVGYTTISAALAGTLPALTMALLILAKIAATSLTIGSGGSGGIFAPSLFLGAMTGGFLGTNIHAFFPEATASSGAYALVTMGAVVAATTHAPISAIIIIFELTQTIDIIPALMVACVVSTVVCQLLSRDSIYTSKLRRQGIDLFAVEDPNVLKGLYVRDVIDPNPEVIPASANFQTILDLVVQSDHSQFFVVDRNNQLLGAISRPKKRTSRS